MSICLPNENSVDADILPSLIRLEANLYAASFPLMKLLPASFILKKAREEKRIDNESVIIETSSGTFGLALARLCALYGYKLKLASDPAIDVALKRRIEWLGAEVHIVEKPAAVGGYQRARLDMMEALQAANPRHFLPSQYHNPYNPGAYAPVAELLAEMLPTIDFLVGTVGSGGSMSGISGYVQPVFPTLRVIGVDTHNSVLFGQPDGKRILRGLGNSLMPKNLYHDLFDEIHWVEAGDAFRSTLELHSKYALFRGPTSGAAFMVARWIANQYPDATVVCLLPDDGTRYQDTVYNQEWLFASGTNVDFLPEKPKFVEHPRKAGKGWERMVWRRRTYEQVMGAPFLAEVGNE